MAFDASLDRLKTKSVNKCMNNNTKIMHGKLIICKIILKNIYFHYRRYDIIYSIRTYLPILVQLKLTNAFVRISFQ